MQKLQLCAAALALAACAPGNDELSGEARKGKGHGGTTTTVVDAAASSGDPSEAGVVSCYTEGAPATTCTLPVHCCFGNYTAQHNGYCTTSSCGWGTIDCDGPEDCAAGQHCCATKDELGWTLACQSSTCGAPPLHEELCHTSETCGGRACVNTIDAGNYDLPRTLYVCR
jgi:hypothetical protein